MANSDRPSMNFRSKLLLSGILCLLFLGAQSLFASVAYGVRYNGVQAQLANGSVSNPNGVAVDLSGNVYVADTGGNRIIEVTAGGTTAPMSISGISPALSSPHQLTVDSAGNLYIADTGNSRIVKIDPSGNGSVVSTSSVTLSAPQGVAVDTSGDIFISDTNNNRIVEVPSGGAATVLATSSGVALTSLSSPRGIATDTFGNLYIVDSGNNRVIKVTTALAGSTLETHGALNAPLSVTVGVNGILYIVDGPTNSRITIVDPQGDLYDLFFGAINNQFGVPSAIAVSPSGTAYITDTEGNVVNAFQVDTAGFGHVSLGSSGTPLTLNFKVSGTSTLTGVAIYTSGTQNLDFTIAANSGTPCTTGSTETKCTVNVQFTPTTAGLRRGSLVLSYNDTILGTGTLNVPLFGYSDAPVAALSPGVASVVSAGSTSVNQPFQTAHDGVGNIYVTSYQDSTLVKIPAGGGAGSTVTIPALPSPTTLNSPTGLAIDGAGNLFISDYNNSRLVEVTPAGTSKVIAVRGLSSGFSFPTSLNFTANGRLLVNDYGHGRIVMLSPDVYSEGGGDGTVGAAVAYVLPLGSYTLGSDNSTGVAADAIGNVYFTDQDNNRIVKLDPLGNLSTLSLPDVTLSGPLGVAVDPSQNLYVVDSGNERIIQQTTTGTTSVLSYSGPSLGQFVFGIDVDGSGNVLVSDFINNRLILDNVSQSSQTFPSTKEFTTSQTRTTTVTNLGNQPLVFSANPTYTASFSQDTSDSNSCTSDTSLLTGVSCDVPLIFSPQAIGSLSANITVTNDALNVAGSTQQIAVSGTSTVPSDTTATTVSVSPTSGTVGQSFAITAKVTDTATGKASTIPTGSVTFIDTVGSTITQLNNGSAVTLDATGTATLPGVVLSAAGTHTITANYSGVTPSFAASSSTATVQVTPDFAINVSGSGSQTAAPGGTATYSLAVGPSSGTVFQAPVTFSVSGLPSGATATLTPSTLPAGSSLTNVTLSIQLPLQAALHSQRLLGRSLGLLTLGTLLLPFGRNIRRFSVKRGHWLCLFLLLLAMATLGLVSCGGQNSGYPVQQPSKTYAITVTATSGSQSHSTTVNLTVQ